MLQNLNKILRTKNKFQKLVFIAEIWLKIRIWIKKHNKTVEKQPKNSENMNYIVQLSEVSPCKGE